MVIINGGGMWENAKWEIHYDEECSEFNDVIPCPHCHSDRSERHFNWDKTHSWDERHWVCPRVVVAYNEAGCDTTGVCLDCIIEAAAKIGGGA